MSSNILPDMRLNPNRPTRNDMRSSPPPPPSSPPHSPPNPTQKARKQRTNPSVTPRRFRRFFTPRSVGAQTNTGPRHALYDITAPLNNQIVTQSSPIRPSQSDDLQENSTSSFPRHFKRRKVTHSTESTPENKRTRVRGPAEKEREFEDLNLQSSPCGKASIGELIAEEMEEEGSIPPPPPQRLVPSSDRGLAGRLLQMSLGSSSRGVRQRYEYPVNDFQDETQAFCSNVDNVYMCRSLEGPNICIPFVTASLNTNSLTAVGDEQGAVRLLESKEGEAPGFKDHYHAFKVHKNAIIDMTFSEDDSLLATASGDSTGRVVDMNTQTTVAILGNHTASLKQIRFQSGSNNRNVLATSSRDGSVQIWDLRCKGLNGPQNTLLVPVEPHRSTAGHSARKILYGRPINSIYNAHSVDPAVPPFVSLEGALTLPPAELTRMGDVSVTTLQFLPSGQEHLLLTASERNAEVRLWDIRTISSKRKLQIPVSITKKPEMHTQWRHFGVTSMNLSTDGTRLFTLCKDNTVYAYSTAHLILGHAPELSLANEGRRLPQRATEEGLGPLHGYRHPKLQVSSFYVKSAIRKAKNGNSEMIAVGSTDGSIILFPTDERYLPKPPIRRQGDEMPQIPPRASLPSLRRSASGRNIGRNDTIPISNNGTALIRGHDREIGSLSWTSEGDLVTIADDYLVRVWHQGEGARDLRIGGESGGRRWQCGWADVSADYDEDEF